MSANLVVRQQTLGAAPSGGVEPPVRPSGLRKYYYSPLRRADPTSVATLWDAPNLIHCASGSPVDLAAVAVLDRFRHGGLPLVGILAPPAGDHHHAISLGRHVVTRTDLSHAGVRALAGCALDGCHDFHLLVMA